MKKKTERTGRKAASSKNKKAATSTETTPVITVSEHEPVTVAPSPEEEKSLVEEAIQSGTETQVSAEVENTEPVVESMTDEAHEWVTKVGAIPLAGRTLVTDREGRIIEEEYAPYRFLGYKAIEDAFEFLGGEDPLDIRQIQGMVHADGPIMVCPFTGKKFQPVMTWPYAPKNMLQKLESGTPWIAIPKYYSGHYFLDKAARKMIAFSGCKFRSDGVTRDFGNPENPLMITVKTATKRRKKSSPSFRSTIWGFSLPDLRLLSGFEPSYREQRKIDYKKAEDRAAQILGYDPEDPAPLQLSAPAKNGDGRH